MNDEELLAGVAARAREEQDDPKLAILDRLAAGERVTESELAGIDPEVVAMFRPLSPAADARIAARIAPKKSKVRVIGVRVSAPFIAAAAAILLFFLWPRHREDGLPDYTFELAGNIAETRAGGPEIVETRATLHRAATLEIVLRPKQKVGGTVGMRATLIRNGQPRPWSPPVQISSEGAVRIVGPVRELFPDLDAPWEILVAVGPEGALPPAGTVFAQAKGYRVVRGFVDFAP